VKLKNSPGAISVLNAVAGHIAKAVVELRQAARELEHVRGLGVLGGPFLADVGVFKVLEDLRQGLKAKAEGNEGLRLVEETPEEDLGPATAVVEQTTEGPRVRFMAPMEPWMRTPVIPVLRGGPPTCSRCSTHLVRGAVGGGHFDWLECKCGERQ
jgi:hypothetical protein